MFGSLDISTSALVAQRIRMDTIAGNIANAGATRRADGQPGPYKRRIALFAAGDGRGGPGVRVTGIREDESPGRMIYQPGHPAYEANISAMSMTKDMLSSTLRLLA